MRPLAPLDSLRPERFETSEILKQVVASGRQLAELKGIAASIPNQAWALARFPFMTGQVVFGIYWQALRLWFKGAPVFDHPPAADNPRETSA